MRKILTLAAFFLGLVAFVYFYQIRGDKKREEAERQQERVFQLERISIDSLRFEYPQRETMVMQRGDRGWRLTEPVSSPAERSTIDFFLDDIENTHIQRRLPAQSEELAEYGLQQPRLVLTVTTSSGDSAVLEVGSEDYSKTSIYARLKDSPEVYLMPKMLMTMASRQPNEWRSKDVFEFEPGQVRKVEVMRSSQSLRFSRSGSQDDWAMESPLQEKADNIAISGLLATLDRVQVDRYGPTAASDLKAFGLERPSASIRIQEEGLDWKQLDTGRSEDGKRWVRDRVRDEVYLVEDGLFEKLTQDLWEFRRKDLVELEPDQVASIAYRRSDLSLEVDRSQLNWVIRLPESHQGRRAISFKFWFPIEDLKLLTLVERGLSFSNPDLEIELKLQDGSTLRLAVIRKGDKHFARNDATRRQGEISKDQFEKLNYALEDIVEGSTADGSDDR